MKIYKTVFEIILLIPLFLFELSCNSIETANDLQINIEDVSCTEVWINISGQIGNEVALNRDDKEVQRFTLTASPQTVYDGSLLPNKTYTYQAIRNNEASNKLVVTTLDTTSNNFTFETYEFGDGYSSSYFNDVWVFSENNIWAVGYISPEDTTINGVHITNPNIIKWDGLSWKIQLYSGTSSGIYGIWALDTSNIYFAIGNVVIYHNGIYKDIVIQGNWTQGQEVEKLWGSSEQNIWGVGPAGTMVHFDGSRWIKIDFNQQWHFYQITGNKGTGVGYAVARNQYDDCIIVKLENLLPEIIYQKSLSITKIASWTITSLGNFIYLVSSDLQSTKICRLSNDGQIDILFEMDSHIGGLQSFALSKNDIYYAGDEGSEARLVHYNGVSYKIINLPQIDPDNYGGIHAIKDLVVSVGFTNNKAYLIKIKNIQ